MGWSYIQVTPSLFYLTSAYYLKREKKNSCTGLLRFSQMLTIKIPKMAKTEHHSPSPPPSSPSSSASSSDDTTSSSDETTATTSSSSSSNNEQPSSETKTQEEQEEGELQPVENGNMQSRKPRKRDRSLFKRIWSQADEIAILKGMVEYQAMHGTVPCTATAIGDFHGSIAESLSITVNNSQLVDKIRRLRKRYCFASTRGKNGEAPRFSTFHGKAVYDLSKKVWGDEGEEEREARPRATKNGIMEIILRRHCPLLVEAAEGTGNKAAGELLEVMEPVRAMDLEGKLRRRKLEVMKHHMGKMELQRETFRLVMEGVERSTR